MSLAQKWSLMIFQATSLAQKFSVSWIAVKVGQASKVFAISHAQRSDQGLLPGNIPCAFWAWGLLSRSRAWCSFYSRVSKSSVDKWSSLVNKRFAKIEWVSICERSKLGLYIKRLSDVANSHTQDLRAFCKRILHLRALYAKLNSLWQSGQPLHLCEMSGPLSDEQSFDIQKMTWLKIWNIYNI
jgi:hypothetical protein